MALIAVLTCFVVGYTMHPTTAGPTFRQVTADWPGHMKRTVELLTGAVCLFAQGSTGNVGPGPEGFTDDARVLVDRQNNLTSYYPVISEDSQWVVYDQSNCAGNSTCSVISVRPPSATNAIVTVGLASRSPGSSAGQPPTAPQANGGDRRAAGHSAGDDIRDMSF